MSDKPHKGHTHSPEVREKIRQNIKVYNGKDHWNWKGGKKRQRPELNGVKYKDWRIHVFTRDDFTCQSCGQYGGYLEADHVMPVSLFPEQMYDPLNGRTLCRPCHMKTFLTKQDKHQLLPEIQLP